MKKVYVVGGDSSYSTWLPFEVTENYEDADVFLFTGGADISPILYDEPTGKYTCPSLGRDFHEKEMFNLARALNKPMIGVCRGGQLITALSGKKLVQHVEHRGRHSIYTSDGRKMESNSLHHQQFLVKGEFTNDRDDDYELLAWTEPSKVHLDGWDKDYNFGESYQDPEVVYFPSTNALCIQPHPEMMQNQSPFVAYCRELVTSKLKL